MDHVSCGRVVQYWNWCIILKCLFTILFSTASKNRTYCSPSFLMKCPILEGAPKYILQQHNKKAQQQKSFDIERPVPMTWSTHKAKLIQLEKFRCNHLCAILLGQPLSRVDMVGTIHNKVLTQWRHMPMGQFHANIFLIRVTSTYFWASEVGTLKVVYFDFFMKKIEKLVWIRC